MPKKPPAGSLPRRSGLFRQQAADASSVPSGTTRRTRYLINGRLSPAPLNATIAEALQFADEEPNRIALCLFPSPTEEDVDELVEAWNLHPVLTEDLRHGGQRPKLERYGEVLFLVVRSAQYIDETEDVDFSEFHVLVRSRAIAVICQDGRWIDGTDDATPGQNDIDVIARGDATLLDDEHLLGLGPEAVLYRLLDAIVDGYIPVIRGLTVDTEDIEDQVFSGDAAVAKRIYRLSHEVIALQQATSSLADVLVELRSGFDQHGIAEPLQAYLQDVSDHLTRAQSRVLALRHALSQILAVNATLVAQRQNEDMKKISGWAAILFAPTLVGAIYGMNFDRMPELHWTFGYPLAIGAMIAVAGALYIFFKRKNWM